MVTGAHIFCVGVNEWLAVIHRLAIVVDDDIKGSLREGGGVSGASVRDLEPPWRGIVLCNHRILCERILLFQALRILENLYTEESVPYKAES